MPTAPPRFSSIASDWFWTAYPPAALLAAAVVMAAGCGKRSGDPDRPAYSREPDLVLGAELAADEVAVEPPAYPGPAAAHAAARATVRYGSRRIDVGNLSPHNWRPARVWVNGIYAADVHYLPRGEIRPVRFDALRDADGKPFNPDLRNLKVDKVEIQLGDEIAAVRFGLGT